MNSTTGIELRLALCVLNASGTDGICAISPDPEKNRTSQSFRIGELASNRVTIE
jgi:hypothetical protein